MPTTISPQNIETNRTTSLITFPPLCLADIKRLPSVPIHDRSLLPATKGIYFVVDLDRVIYIGMSINVQARWKSHEKFTIIKKAFGTEARIHAFEITKGNIGSVREMEIFLIDKFNPILNGKHYCFGAMKIGNRIIPVDEFYYNEYKRAKRMVFRFTKLVRCYRIAAHDAYNSEKVRRDVGVFIAKQRFFRRLYLLIASRIWGIHYICAKYIDNHDKE